MERLIFSPKCRIPTTRVDVGLHEIMASRPDPLMCVREGFFPLRQTKGKRGKDDGILLFVADNLHACMGQANQAQ